jgi:hypothetical protein
MKNLIRSLIVFSLLGYGNIILAQSVIPASGGDATGTGGTASFSLGQPFYITIESTTGSVAQGVQQPYEISVVTSVESAVNINIICSVYPNPSSAYLTLSIANIDSKVLAYKLYDLNGHLLETKEIHSNETAIQMNKFIKGEYFLKVSNAGKEIKTFKIIKN